MVDVAPVVTENDQTPSVASNLLAGRRGQQCDELGTSDISDFTIFGNRIRSRDSWSLGVTHMDTQPLVTPVNIVPSL